MDRPKILIAEDNPISRRILKLALESDNYTVVEVSDGASALREAANQKFDLIIQDIVLPDMDGMFLNKKLRELPHSTTIPILALSGFLNPIDTQNVHSGFTTVLLKPIDPSYLLEVVKAQLPISMPSKNLVGNGKHILIADDNTIQLKLFSMQLKNVGFEVTTAADGVIALKEAFNKQPNVIISDILMPNMDGFSLCLEIKKDPKLNMIPVILLTSHYLDTEDLALAKKVGASLYLTRTPDVETLISKVLSVLDVESPNLTPIVFELTEEIKEKHFIRSIRQLEQQVLDNTKLAQRCAMLMSQLSLIDGIANALTTSNKGMDESFKDVLYFCLDATGISKGALYLQNSSKKIVLAHQVGYLDTDKKNLESFFGLSDLIPTIIENNKFFAIPSEHLSFQAAKNFLDAANIKSALIIPMFSGFECLGLLFLGSDLTSLSSENTLEFVRALGTQFGQSIALSSTFDKLGSSEKRYRQLVEISPDAIFIEQDDKFVYANNSALTLLNANNFNELSTRLFYDFFPPDYQKVIKKYIQQHTDKVSISLTEGKITTFKGDTLDVEIVISSFNYQDKSALYLIMRDITERKRSALYLELQYAIAWILAESSTLVVATTKILEIICERLNWDCGTIWAVDKEAQLLRCTKTWQKPQLINDAFLQESQNLNYAFGVGLPGETWSARKAIWKSDIKQYKGFLRKKSAETIGLNTGIAFPIIYENEVLGVIEFFSRNIIKPNPHSLLWFESIGNQFGLFLMRKHMEKQMLYLAEHDVLTGLSNRSLLEQTLATAITNAEETTQKLAILFLDLDHFKYVNDSMGHQVGDLLLKEICERFRLCLRPQDTISRLGGDEFVIIIPNVHEKDKIIEIIGRLQAQLSKQIFLKEKEVFVTASIGISFYPDDGNAVQTLIKAADIAMYAAKEKGRNTFQFCTAEMTIKAETRGTLKNNLRSALANNEFLLHYQPKIDVATKTVTGMEALIRWKRPEGILLPEHFMAAIEDSELIIPISEWVTKTAYMQNKAWQDAGLPTMTMSINLSVRNLNRQILQVMENILAETKLKPNSFEVELTESVLMVNIENNIQVLHALKDMGFKISIDDFGTGYSSLSYLKRFPIDILKIDQSFVRDIAIDPDDAAIVTAIIAMAHSLGFRVIAEGVETAAQLKFLCDHGCDEIQGYYFSRPLPAEQAADFIKNKLTW